MGKALIIILAAFMVAGAFYALGARQGVGATSKRVAVHQNDLLVRNAARAGYEAARGPLTREFTSTTMQGPHGSGEYVATVTVSGDKARIVAEGRVPQASGAPIMSKIIAEVQRTVDATIPDEPPLFMQYALLSEGNLSLNGNVLGDILVLGGERTTLNANMHR